jgi:hypothetical protein
VSFPDFPSLVTTPAISKRTTFKYPQDEWSDPAVVSIFDDQQSVEVQSTGSGGFWSNLAVVVQAQEADANIILAFLQGRRLRGLPFYFTHRARGRLLVRYWADVLPVKRVVAGNPDLIQFDLPLRQEAGT